jgi:hypothetical protein
MRFGGHPTRHWHLLHYGRLIKEAAKDIYAEFGSDIDVDSIESDQMSCSKIVN